MRQHEIVLDWDDTRRSARFWAWLTGVEVVEGSDERWASVLLPTGMRLAFQHVEGYRPPQWPGGLSQQAHLDGTVTDIGAAHARAVALGARAVDPDEAPVRPDARGYRVYLDPAGHPFCLCRPSRGAWA